MRFLQSFHRRCLPLHVLLAGILLVECLVHERAWADEPAAKNIGFKVRGSVVEVYYDLVASSDQIYKVSIQLKRRFDKGYVYSPVRVSGDVGSAVPAGDGKSITWVLTDEFPNGLPGEDCFFVIGIEEAGAAPHGISSLVWIAGGAGLVGGVIVAVLLSSKGGGTGPGPNPPAFPMPPGRP